jgi:hypothetical protein
MSIDGIDLIGKRVKLKNGVLCKQLEHERPMAEGGFGCSPTARGSAVFLRFSDGELARFNRDEIEEVVE